jgi:hypothetical protein
MAHLVVLPYTNSQGIGVLMQEHRCMSTACQATNTSSTHLMDKWRGTTLSILKFEISINVVRILIPYHAFVQVVVEVSFNGCLQQAHDVVRTGHPFMYCSCRSHIVTMIAQRWWLRISSWEPSFCGEEVRE